MSLNVNNMLCEPCGKIFTGPLSYNQHIESDKHKRKVSSLNTISNTSEKKVFNNSKILSPNSLENSIESPDCSTCCLQFNSFKDFQIHCISTEHAKRVIENNKDTVSLIEDRSHNTESNPNVIPDKSDIILPEVEMFKSQASFSFCNACKKSFSGPEPYKQHIESAGHIKKIELGKKISQGIGVAALELSCAPCKKMFSGPVPYDQHMNSDIHRKKIESLQLLEKIEVDASLKVNMNGLDPGPLNKESNPLFCKICSIICSGPAPFEQHIKGITHLKNLRKAQNERSTDDIQCSNLQINGFNMSKKDAVLPELLDNNEVAYIVKLDESITMFLPEEEIDFDEQNNKASLKLEESEEIDSDEQNNKNNLKPVEKIADELELLKATLDACSLTCKEKKIF